MLPAILVVAGGIFVLLMGLATATPDAPLSYLSVYGGPVGILLGALLIAAPGLRRAIGVLSVVLAALSIPYSYGGLVVGAFLLAFGGVLAFVWEPVPPGRLAELRAPGARGRD
jgi:Family of unknown function (DUF6114)